MKRLLALALVLAPEVQAQEVDRFGDPLPDGAVARLGASRFHHERWIFSIDFSDDGEHVVSCSGDGVVRRWKRADGALETELVTELRTALHASLRDSALALATPAGVGLWNLEDGTLGRRLEGRVGLLQLAPDGKLATLGGDGVVQLYSADGEATHNLVAKQFLYTNLDWAPDSESFVAVATNRNKLLGRAGTREEPTARLVRHDATGAPVGAAIELQDENIVGLHVAEGFLAASDPTGAMLVWGPDGELLADLESTGAAGTATAFSADGRLAARPMSGGRVQVLDARTWEEVAVFSADHADGAPLAFSPDGDVLAVSTGLSFELWNPRTGERILGFPSHEGPVLALAFSPDGERLYSAGHDRYVRAWELASSEELWRRYAHTDLVNDVSVSATGARIVTGSRDGRAILWSDSGAQIHRLAGHSGAVTGVSLAPDGASLASVAGDKSALVWDTTTGELLARLEGLVGVLFEVDHAPDGRLLVGGVELVLADGLLEEHRVLRRAPASITAQAVAPNGELAALGLADRSVHVIDLESGTTLRNVERHRGRLRAVAFGPDSKLLATSSQGERAIHLWKVADGTSLGTLGGLPAEASSLAVAPDGRRLAAGCQDGSIFLFALPGER